MIFSKKTPLNLDDNKAKALPSTLNPPSSPKEHTPQENSNPYSLSQSHGIASVSQAVPQRAEESINPAERVATRHKLIEEILSRRDATKIEISKSIPSNKLASIFLRKSDFLEDDATAPYYINKFIVWAAEIVSKVEALNDPEFNGETFFSILLDGYRRVPKLCLEALYLLVNVEDFLDHHGKFSPEDCWTMRIRALSASMGKGIFSARHLIKGGLIHTRAGDGKLHDGPTFTELNRLFTEKEKVCDENIRVAFAEAWKSALNALADADIPVKYQFNMYSGDIITSLIKIIIADTAMERNYCGLNFRKRKLAKTERIGEIVRNTGLNLKYSREATLVWLGAQKDQESLDLVYYPAEISMLDVEGADRYVGTLLDCLKALFPNVGEVDPATFKGVLQTFLKIEFSVKKKFMLRLTPEHSLVNVQALDYSGKILIRKENVKVLRRNRSDFLGSASQIQPEKLGQIDPEQRRKRSLDLDI